MRVDYTLPAIQPESPQEIQPGGEEAPRSFREQLRTTEVQIPDGWEHQLGLDIPPFTSNHIGPPPRQAVDLSDAETERDRWQRLLWRHCDLLDRTDGVGNKGAQPVQAMLAMLLQMQDMADDVISQQVAVTRG